MPQSGNLKNNERETPGQKMNGSTDIVALKSFLKPKCLHVQLGLFPAGQRQELQRLPEDGGLCQGPAEGQRAI